MVNFIHALEKTTEMTKAHVAKDTIYHSLYVDDLTCSSHNLEDTITAISESKRSLPTRGFNRTKFISTQDEVLSAIDACNRIGELLTL